jgi:hypothetical protein
MTGQQLINSALRLIGALAQGESPTADETTDAQLIANQMLDSWTAERLMIFNLDINEFSLVPGQQTYTMGTGGNFNVARPSQIERVSIVSLANPAQPLELPLEMVTDADWQAIPVKLISSTLPQKVYDDGDFPLRSLSYWCIPTVVVKTRIYGWTALTQFADLTTDQTYPPGYTEALRYNLAVRLAPEWGVGLTPEVAQLAMETKATVKRSNVVIADLRCDAAVLSTGGSYNWLTD